MWKSLKLAQKILFRNTVILGFFSKLSFFYCFFTENLGGGEIVTHIGIDRLFFVNANQKTHCNNVFLNLKGIYFLMKTSV